jgi:hypothetical protein
MYQSESSICPTVHESEAVGQKVHYAQRFMNMKLFVRKFIMSDGQWIWSSWSESSLCQTVHEFVCRYSDHWSFTPMNLRTNEATDGTLDRWNFGHNKFSELWTVQWTIKYKNNFSFRFLNRRTYWTFWPRATNSWTVWHNELMSDGSWIWSSWSESLLCQTVDGSEALCQKVHYVRRSMDLKLLVRKFIPSDIINFLTKSFRSINRLT